MYKDPEKQREYQRQWVAKRRAEFFADKQCVQCDSNVDLELDHIDPNLKISHNIWSWSKVRQEEEIAKCQILCKDCHEEKTAIENSIRNGGKPHGSSQRYKIGCRCNDCKFNWNEKKRLNRLKRKALGLSHQ